jgi:hypothetical protein
MHKSRAPADHVKKKDLGALPLDGTGIDHIELMAVTVALGMNTTRHRVNQESLKKKNAEGTCGLIRLGYRIIGEP